MIAASAPLPLSECEPTINLLRVLHCTGLRARRLPLGKADLADLPLRFNASENAEIQ